MHSKLHGHQHTSTDMAPSTYTRVVFAERPKGAIDPDTTFRVVEAPFDLKPADDEALVKVEYLSLDPAMRLWLNAEPVGAYMPTLATGSTMMGIGLGTVIEAGANSGVAVGDHVSGYVGRRDLKTAV